MAAPPQQSFPPPPLAIPLGTPRKPSEPSSQKFFPPPPQSPPATQTSYPPPPTQSPSNSSQNTRMSYASPSATPLYSPPPASAPPTQTHFQFPPEKDFGPPPSGGQVGYHPTLDQPLMSPRHPLDSNKSPMMPGGAPLASHFMGAATSQDDVGTFNGGSYRISHRDCNTILTLQLALGCPLTAKPGT